MTRKEQIENEAIIKSVNMFLKPIIYNNELSCAYSDGFKSGARWADEHPNWYKISDNVYNLPDEIGGRYNVVLKNRPNETLYGIFYGDYWNIGGQSYLFHEVAFWAELPQPPKFD